jgi:3-deoxy-manno-octulosonate cytidylyltransferase (CMP-KDO synthetase)
MGIGFRLCHLHRTLISRANPLASMKTVAFIPARYDSTRFPGKPLALIKGKPMIQHVYRCAVSCPHVTDVYVATDDERISRCVHDFGGRAIMTEKAHPSGTDRIAEAAQRVKLSREDLIINIQGDQPLFRPSTVSQLLEPLLEDPRLPMGTLKYRIKDERDLENPNHVKVVTDVQGFALYFSRSPIPFLRDTTSTRLHYKHLGVYAYRMGFLVHFVGLPLGRLESAEKLEQLRALEYGFKIKVVESTFDSIEVDTPMDIKIVEDLMDRTGIGQR